MSRKKDLIFQHVLILQKKKIIRCEMQTTLHLQVRLVNYRLSKVIYGNIAAKLLTNQSLCTDQECL